MSFRMNQRLLALILFVLVVAWCTLTPGLMVAAALRGQPPGSYPTGGLFLVFLGSDAIVAALAGIGFVLLGRRLPV